MTTLIAIAGILIAVALQARMPTLWWLGGVRVELLPALVVYAALTMHRRRALVLALVAGLAQDALSAAPFGISALAYGIATIVLTSLREALDRDLPWMQWMPARRLPLPRRSSPSSPSGSRLATWSRCSWPRPSVEW
jgi:rod shape-determining protein MreD